MNSRSLGEPVWAALASGLGRLGWAHLSGSLFFENALVPAILGRQKKLIESLNQTVTKQLVRDFQGLAGDSSQSVTLI